MPCQGRHAELMADSLPCFFGPFANYGAIGQPVILPPAAASTTAPSPPAATAAALSSMSASPHSNAATTRSSPPTSASSSASESPAARHRRLFWVKLTQEDPGELARAVRAAREARERANAWATKLPWMNCPLKHLTHAIEHWTERKGRWDIPEGERREAADKASELQQYFEERKVLYRR
ncbi:MAG: hypothetical protein Q9196_007271 [Gyalolechia fulgens]